MVWQCASSVPYGTAVRGGRRGLLGPIESREVLLGARSFGNEAIPYLPKPLCVLFDFQPLRYVNTEGIAKTPGKRGKPGGPQGENRST